MARPDPSTKLGAFSVRALAALAATALLASSGCSDAPGTGASADGVAQETFDVPSAAQPADTPGSPGVAVTHPKLLAQFGGSDFTLNQARYTRWRQAGPAKQPDSILVLIPGF